MGELKCTVGVRQGESFSLSAGTFTIGRGENYDLDLSAEAGVSKLHAKITAENEMYVLIDNESRNGTMLNGKPISRAVLTHGDNIRICGCSLTFFSLGSTGVHEAGIETASQLVNQASSVDAGPSNFPPLTEEARNETDALSVPATDGEEPEFYSDDLHAVDDNADTIQPVHRDEILTDQNAGEDSLTVQAAMVGKGKEDLELTATLAQLRDPKVMQPDRTVQHQDMVPKSSKPSPGDVAAPAASGSKGSGTKSFVAGIVLVFGLYGVWHFVPQDIKTVLFEGVSEAENEPAADSPKAQAEEGAANKETGSNVANNLPWIEVKASAAQGPVIRSPASGVVSDLKVTAGNEIVRGQMLFVVRNSRMSSDIETVKLSINSLESLAKNSDTREIKETLAEEKAKLRSLQEQQKVVVKAPKGGTVKSVKVTSGEGIRKGTVAITLRSKSRILRYKIPTEQATGFDKDVSVEVRDGSGKVSPATISSKSGKNGEVFVTLKREGKGAIEAIRLVPAK